MLRVMKVAGSRGTLLSAVVLPGAILLAACGSSSGGTAATAGSGTQTTTAQSSGAPAAGVTIKAASVAGYGMVLVDGNGRTLYMLTSEQGGKITCTDANGCTKVWPDTELPKGVSAATAGPGIQASLLSTVKDASGSLYVTYGGWPLYTYTGDSSTGQANGENITSFGGTWYVLDVSGHPVTTKTGAGSTSTTSSGGYGY